MCCVCPPSSRSDNERTGENTGRRALDLRVEDCPPPLTLAFDGQQGGWAGRSGPDGRARGRPSACPPTERLRHPPSAADLAYDNPYVVGRPRSAPPSSACGRRTRVSEARCARPTRTRSGAPGPACSPGSSRRASSARCRRLGPYRRVWSGRGAAAHRGAFVLYGSPSLDFAWISITRSRFFFIG